LRASICAYSSLGIEKLSRTNLGFLTLPLGAAGWVMEADFAAAGLAAAALGTVLGAVLGSFAPAFAVELAGVALRRLAATEGGLRVVRLGEVAVLRAGI